MTTDTTPSDKFPGQPHLRNDLGVAIVVIIALLLGWLLRSYTLNRTIVFQDPDTGLSLKYPAAWGVADLLQFAVRHGAKPAAAIFRTKTEVNVITVRPNEIIQTANLEMLPL